MAMDNGTCTRTFACGSEAPSDASPTTVGNKAANLIRMAEAGLPVPAGFVITTGMCRDYFERGCRLPEDFSSLIRRDLEQVECATGLRFGGQRRPLLVSARSGAAASMPGMMDTIPNLGLCERTVSPLIRLTGNPRFVWDSYRRLVQTYGAVVRGLPAEPFERLLDQQARREAVETIRELDAFALRDLTNQFLDLYSRLAGESFPQDPLVQLVSAIEAIFRSSRSPRAVEYRRLHGIPHDLGTAVTVQAMVFGSAPTMDGGARASVAANRGRVGTPVLRRSGLRVHRSGRPALSLANPRRQTHALGSLADRLRLGGRASD
jgi:pyruvate,orthophosphate dikinase